MSEMEQQSQPVPGIMLINCQVGMGVTPATEASPAGVFLDLFNDHAMARASMSIEGLDQLIENLGKIRSHATGQGLQVPRRGLVGINGEQLSSNGR